MNQVLEANIFFFITSICVILVTLVVLFILYYVFRTVRNIKKLTDSMRENGEEVMESIRDDSSELRRGMRRYSGEAAKIIALSLGRYLRSKMRKRRSSHEQRHRDQREEF